MSKRGTNIYKRKDGRWEARYVASIGLDGKKKYSSVYAPTYQEAKSKQLDRLKNIHLNLKSGSNPSLEEIMWIWLSTNANSVKQSTFQKYESVIRNHIAGEISRLQVQYISSQIINQYAYDKLRGERNLSPKTINDILTIISMGLSFAEQEYGYTKPKIRRVKEDHKEMRVLSRNEQAILEKYLLQDLDLYKLGVIITLYSGLRIGELCALHWEDVVDVRITATKSYRRIKKGSSTVLELTTPKTNASIRVIPVPTSIQK